MKKGVVLLLSLIGLTSCAYIPENVRLSYHPLLQSQLVPEGAGKNIQISVVDSRRDGKLVSCKKGDHGVELASIKLKGNLASDIEKAITTELTHLGYGVAQGDLSIEIEIQKFYNEFKQGFMGGRGVAELFIGVHVKKTDGNIIYAKNILGLGENDSVWLHSGKNAKIALEGALDDAIHKLMNDQAFLQALQK